MKVIASGAVFAFGGVPGAPEMTQEEIAAVVEVAHAAGIKVTAHVHSTESGKDALRAGVDTFEHASLLDDEAIAMVAEAGIALSMDVYNGTYTEEVGREQNYPEEYMREKLRYDRSAARGLRKGLCCWRTDPVWHRRRRATASHGRLAIRHHGRARHVADGCYPLSDVRPADHMGIAADVGALEAGRYGDLIAVSGNPLTDMKRMREVDVVIKGGLVFKNESGDE